MTSEGGGVSGGQSWLPIVGGFTVVRRIGSGGYSTVFEAVQEDIGAPVALKILEGAYDARGRSRFERECQSMGRLRDERGIVSVYSATYTSDQHPVIVMAYLPGGSLADRIKADGPMSVEDVVAVAQEICAALTAAHASGIYHRDIKPENILLDRFGRAALTDFGIATLAGEITSTETASSLTPAHAPPERYLTEVDTGDPVHGDIYSLASTLYALLAGAPPHGTVREGGIAALIDRILDEPPIPLTRTDVPEPVVSALLRGLSKNPSDRFDTAVQLLTALESPVVVVPGTPLVVPASPVAAVSVPSPPAVSDSGADDLDRTRRRDSFVVRDQPPVDISPPTDSEAVHLTGVAAPPRPSRTRLRISMAIAIGAVIVAGSLGGAWLASDPTKAEPCVKGTTWTQKPSPFADGLPIGSEVSGRAALVQGGARFGFSGKDEFEQMGHNQDLVPVTDAQLKAVDERPRDGLVLKSSPDGGTSYQYFYTQAGTLFRVRDLPSLKSVGTSVDEAIPVPVGAIDRASKKANVPKGGTLVRIAGTKTTWLIDGASRRPASALCFGAKFVEVPSDPKIMDGIDPLYGK